MRVGIRGYPTRKITRYSDLVPKYLEQNQKIKPKYLSGSHLETSH
jgi:hypothetical protein